MTDTLEEKTVLDDGQPFVVAPVRDIHEERLRLVLDQHFAELTKFGVLKVSAIRDAIDAAELEAYRFSVHVHNREVPLLRQARDIDKLTRPITLQHEYCQIEISQSTAESKDTLLVALLHHLQFVVLNTLVWRNLQKIRHRTLYEKLRAKVEENDDNVTIETLPTLIKREMDISVEIVELVKPVPTEAPPPRTEHEADDSTEGTEPGKPLGHFVRRSPGQSRMQGQCIDDPALVKLILIEALGRATTLDITRYLDGDECIRDDIAVLVPLCRSSARKSARSQLFLLRGTPERPLTLEDITTVEAVVTFYLEEVLYSRQREYLLTLLSEIIDASAQDEEDLERRYNSVLIRSINRIITDTTAYRCSVWHLDHQQNVIRVGPMATYENGKLQDIFHVALTPIPANARQRSSIAYVMAGAEGEGYLLLHDCQDPSHDIKGKSIEKIITPTGETQSELAVQIRQHAIPHSVLLAESRLNQGFESDKWYIQAVCSLLSEFRRTLHQRLDSSYITERLSVFDTAHDLDVFIDINMVQLPEIADKLRQFLRIGAHDQEALQKKIHFEIADLLESIKPEYVSRTHEVVESIFSRIHIDTMTTLRGTHQIKHAIKYILKNLVSNAFRYEAISSTIIGIRLEQNVVPWAGSANNPKLPKPIKPTERILRIEAIIDPPLLEEIESQIGKRSIASGARGGRRGLYLIGLIVRQLAGAFAVHRTKNNRRTKFLIRIPVEVVLQGDDTVHA